MSPFTLARRLAPVLASRHVVVLGSRSALRSPQVLPRILKGGLAASARGMAASLEPGDLGAIATTWTGRTSPERLTVGALPDEVSRHASPSRNHAIHACLAKIEPKTGSVGVVLVLDDAAHAVAAAGAAGRAFPIYSRKTRRKGPGPRVQVALVDGAARIIAPGNAATETVAAARWAACLVDRPTAELTTEMFVEEARAFLGPLARRVTVKVLVGDQLLAAGLGGIHAVGRAAEVAPRLLVLESKPAATSSRRAGGARRVALVGKGIVFDTGGLALKPRDGMCGMKGDMGGGAAVVGAFRTLVAEGTPHHLHCLVPLAENAIGSRAYRHDEILTLHSGRTVEINNTDAEGRLLLADGVSYAARVLGARVILDAATLTGAQLVATGKRHAAVVSNLEGLEQLAVRAGRVSGDLCHPLPFAPEFFRREFRSEIADMLNSVKDRSNAQSSCAAQFVWSHVDDTGVAWLHVDLAGPAHPDGRGSGFGVALLAEVVRGLTDEVLAG